MNFPKNEATWDRIVRFVLAVVLFVVGLGVGGLVGIIAILAGAVLAITGAVGFCPLYRALGMSTMPKE
ncbi:MAG: hypothetical protein Kow00117_00270 [Phototrophicales bacterium]